MFIDYQITNTEHILHIFSRYQVYCLEFQNCSRQFIGKLNRKNGQENEIGYQIRKHKKENSFCHRQMVVDTPRCH